MITGVHALIYSTDPEADRAFLRDVLKFPYVEHGDDWLIFRLPPAELGVHPAMEGGERHEVYFMTGDITAAVADLAGRGHALAEPVTDKPYGTEAGIRLPGGGIIRIYQPRHPTAIQL
jgi:catechol 2,3-dioxygenase-like lactoylglutathione lyase family enzyme